MLKFIQKNIYFALSCTLIGSLFFLQGCPIAVVAIIAAYSGNGDITVTVEVPRPSPEVFEAAKKRVERGVTETGIKYNVVSIDEGRKIITIEGADKSWRGDFIVVPLSSGESQVIAKGSDDIRSRAESENLILLGIENLCKDLGVKYNVIERNMG